MESKRIFKGKHDELQSRLVSDFIGNTPNLLDYQIKFMQS